MRRPEKNKISHARFGSNYALLGGNRVVITTVESGAQCQEVAADKAQQLQALLMAMEEGWGGLSEINESLGKALMRLASDLAGDIAGISELSMKAGAAEFHGDGND